MSHCKGSMQSQLGMMVQGCWQAAVSVQEKHCERPDTLANEPGLQQPHEDWPTTWLKEPGAHREHVYEPVEEWDPAGHTVNVSTILKLTELLPAP